MAKKNVLVFPCGSEIGLEIHKSLQYSTHFTVFGGSSVDDHGLFVYKNYIPDMPFFDAPDFIEKLNKLVAEHKIDFIMPAHDDVVVVLAQAKAAGKLQAEVVTSSIETCQIARSKLQTYQTLQDVIPTPQVYKSVEAVPEGAYPIFLKPESGQGSRGTQKATTAEAAAFYLKQDSSLLLLEYLPGKEFTVDCFTDKDGKLQVSEGRERTRISNGISVNSSVVKDPRFAELANKINQKLSFRGAWFFQVKENTAGELVLMEIAPRIAGTMGLIRCRGINLVLLSLFDAMGYPIDAFENDYQMTIDRALQNTYSHDVKYSCVYLDLDDSVLVDGKVNPDIMAFVYQCHNEGVKVCLLTRHKADLGTTLKKYRLSDAFDELIQVAEGQEKAPLITQKDAIFIDDSFAERKKVHQACGIPVFDTHMVESLLTKF